MDPYAIGELKSIILPIARRYGVQKIVLFGSYARGEGFRATNIFALAEELRDALQRDVDLYEIRESNPGTAFHQAVMREGLEIAGSISTSNAQKKSRTTVTSSLPSSRRSLLTAIC